MSEIESQPFTHNLNEVAREAWPHYLNVRQMQTYRDMYIPKRIAEIPKEHISEARKYNDSFSRPNLSLELVQGRYDGVEVAVVMILDNHELIAQWDEVDKRKFLDIALEEDNIDKQRQIARHERDKAYWPAREILFHNVPINEDQLRLHDGIKRNRELQSKLRQRVSPSHPSTRK